MSTEIRPGKVSIDFAPASVREEVIQNVSVLLSTMRYTVPYARGLGVNPEYLDDPMPAARARAVADITSTIHRYEPRCRVESVAFDVDPKEGVLIPRVRVSINE